MRRILTLLLVVAIFAGVFSVVEAATLFRFRSFGGRVAITEAAQVEALTAAGFVCGIEGQTFDIVPAGKFPSGPYRVSFEQLEQAGVNTLKIGQLVLGRYVVAKIPVAECTNGETVVLVWGHQVGFPFSVNKSFSANK